MPFPAPLSAIAAEDVGRHASADCRERVQAAALRSGPSLGDTAAQPARVAPNPDVATHAHVAEPGPQRGRVALHGVLDSAGDVAKKAPNFVVLERALGILGVLKGMSIVDQR